jgi:hypothetical protein
MNRAIAPPTFACTFVNAEFFASLVAILRDFVDILGEPTESEREKKRTALTRRKTAELMIVREGIKIKMMDCQ